MLLVALLLHGLRGAFEVLQKVIDLHFNGIDHGPRRVFHYQHLAQSILFHSLHCSLQLSVLLLDLATTQNLLYTRPDNTQVV